MAEMLDGHLVRSSVLAETTADLAAEQSWKPSTIPVTNVSPAPDLRVTTDAQGQLQPGQSSMLSLQGSPNTRYLLIVRSAPRVVSEVTTDAAGRADVSMQVEWWAHPGVHLLTAEDPVTGEAVALGGFTIPASIGCEPASTDVDGDGLMDRCDGDPNDGQPAISIATASSTVWTTA